MSRDMGKWQKSKIEEARGCWEMVMGRVGRWQKSIREERESLRVCLDDKGKLEERK
jgi:hypothetical protein